MNNTKTISKQTNTEVSNAVKGIIGEGVNVSVHLTKKKVQIEDYVMLFQEAVLMMLNGNMSKTMLKIFVYFLGKLKYSNHIGVDQKTIAEENGVSIDTVKPEMAKLIKMNIIVVYKDIQDKRRNVYIINPRVAWKGTVSERKKVIKRIIDQNQTALPLNFDNNGTK